MLLIATTTMATAKDRSLNQFVVTELSALQYRQLYTAKAGYVSYIVVPLSFCSVNAE